MHSTQVILVTFVFASLLCCALSRSVPDHARTRVRRQVGDMQMAHHRAEIALKQLAPKACEEAGCGLIDILQRLRRSTSDQRVAELKALTAMFQGGYGGTIGHGSIDPFEAGKRKRSEGSELNEFTRSSKLRLLRRLVDDLMYGDS